MYGVHAIDILSRNIVNNRILATYERMRNVAGMQCGAEKLGKPKTGEAEDETREEKTIFRHLF